MTSRELKIELRKYGLRYARKSNLRIDESHASAVLFLDLQDNFHPDSFERIQQNPAWRHRLKKSHQSVANAYEMQSSNSSDVLLMSIFCHPEINVWKGVRELLNVKSIDPEFGFKVSILKADKKGDSSEIDMRIDNLLVEAKLTEEDFTQKEATVVEGYEGLSEHFHVECLVRDATHYDNYQVIRNLLAAIQHNKHHALFCDERRPDLARRYMETVCCLKDSSMRRKCRVVFWQEIQKACGDSLAQFLKDKYGFSERGHRERMPRIGHMSLKNIRDLGDSLCPLYYSV